MATILNVRTLFRDRRSRTAVIVVVTMMAVAAGGSVAARHLYRTLTTTTVTAYFPETLALYSGDTVQIMGVRVGSIDSIEPDGPRSKVVLHFDSANEVPANATASVLNPSLVASRTIQLSPPYTGGPTLQDGAVIPLERTRVPVEWDDLRGQVARVAEGLGPSERQPRGPVGDVIESFADALSGRGRQLNTTFTSLSDALTALNHGGKDFFAVIHSLALFVNTLRVDDQRFAALNTDLAKLTGALDDSDQELGRGVSTFRRLLDTTKSFLDRNGDVAERGVKNFDEVTTAILQPEPRAGLENVLHVLPAFGANFANIYAPANGALTGLPVLNGFANPLQMLCSSIQAASRLGYQESAELCAQYLAPILDALKFNHLPFGFTPFTTASTLPKHIAYSEERLRPPPGYKDTTVPGVWTRDTPFSHGNHEPGWITAPGMEGLELGPLTSGMLAPESLDELLGVPLARSSKPGVDGGLPPASPEADGPAPTEPRGDR